MDRIPVLIAEYNTLRAELIQRSTIYHQFFPLTTTALITLLGWVVVTGKSLCLVLLLAAIAVLVLYVMHRRANYDTRKLGEHLRGLEERVNRLAGSDGETLLTWEAKAEMESIYNPKNRKTGVARIGQLFDSFFRTKWFT
jgi:hypothetical protein